MHTHGFIARHRAVAQTDPLFMSETLKSSFKPPVWLKPDGSVLACVEKIKMLNENLAELRDLAQDALDDAVLMGGTQAQIKQTLLEIIERLDSQYPEQTP